MTEFHLLIDDLRALEMDQIARTGEAGLRALRSSPVTHLYMDHDLGDDTTDGYRVLMQALEEGICPPNVFLVTSNPVGRQNMVAALENHGYQRSGSWYHRVSR